MDTPTIGERPRAVQQASADVLRVVAGLSNDLVAVVDRRSHLTYGSESLWSELGREPGDVHLDELLDLVHPDDLAAVRAQLAAAAAAPGEPIEAEFRVRGPDGETRHVEARIVDCLNDQAVQGTVLAIRDRTDRAHLQSALRALQAGNQVLVRSVDEAGLLRSMCETIVRVGSYRLAWVGYAEDDEDQTVVPVASAGDVAYAANLHVSWGDNEFGRGPTGTAIRTNSIQLMPDMRTDASFRPWQQRALAHGLRTSCVLPLSEGDSVIGAVSIYSDEVGAFDAPSVRLLEQLAADLTYGIARLRDAARLTAAFGATVTALRAMAELRDPYTAGHQERVGVLAGAIAQKLGMTDAETTWIRVAGELHDIGKVVVPAEILAKPGRLSDAEMDIIRGHTRAGYDIIRGIGFPGGVAEIVLQHHERLDGSGYPEGRRGDEILIGARILAVADTVEAMANHRPYRPALGIDMALNEIDAGSGTRFDPDVVTACTELFNDDGFVFEEPAGLTSWGSWIQPLERQPPPAERA
jgi:putative nucleotidyltransferase with HDIG domain/PAS domain S-box-containing protein